MLREHFNRNATNNALCDFSRVPGKRRGGERQRKKKGKKKGHNCEIQSVLF